MRNANFVAIPSTAVSGTTAYNSTAIDAQQVVGISAQVVGTSTAAGSIQIQASNDVPPGGGSVQMNSFTPTNWSNILAAGVALTAAGTSLVPFTNTGYRWLRVQYTNATGSGNIVATVNVIGLN